MNWKCEHAQSGCNYPEGECVGLCEIKTFNPIIENKQAEPVADHSGLIKRIEAAIERVTQGRGLMSIPADPRSDVDLVLSECKALLQGENPPFWAKDFHPAPGVAVNEPDPSKCFNAAINYALKCGNGDGGLEFLACWREGNFDAIRKEWPDAPDAVFEGAEVAKGGAV